jgi:hypothetical protein
VRVIQACMEKQEFCFRQLKLEMATRYSSGEVKKYWVPKS